jgi:hypothetical protein
VSWLVLLEYRLANQGITDELGISLTCPQVIYFSPPGNTAAMGVFDPPPVPGSKQG